MRILLPGGCRESSCPAALGSSCPAAVKGTGFPDPEGSEGRFQGLRELVGTRGSLSAAVDPLQACDGFRSRHALHEGRNALGVPVAAARKRDAADDAVLEVDVDLPRAGALAGMGDMSYHAEETFFAAQRYETPG